VEALPLLLMLGLPLAGDGEHALLDLDLDLVAIDARQVGAKDEVVLGLDQVHRRNPPPRAVAVRRSTLPAAEEAVEEPVHVALKCIQIPSRIPSHKCHFHTS
jgi:hypothetical protein